MATNISTVGATGRDYATLTLWEAATDVDLVAAGDIEVAEVYADADLDYQVFFNGATTDSSNYREVRAAPGEGHDGTLAGAGVTWRRTTGGHTCIVYEDFLRIGAGMLFAQTTSGGDSDECFRIGAIGQLVEGLWIDGALINCERTTGGAGDGLWVGNYDAGTATNPLRVTNCAITNWTRAGIHSQGFSGSGYSHHWEVANTTIDGCAYGIGVRYSGTSTTQVRMVNLLVGNCSSKDYGSTSGDLTNCTTTGSLTNFGEAASDLPDNTQVTLTESTSPGAGSWAIVSSINGDLSLVDDADNDVLQAGSGTSDDALVPAFDILGVARGAANASPGAFDVAVVGGIVVTPPGGGAGAGGGEVTIGNPVLITAPGGGGAGAGGGLSSARVWGPVGRPLLSDIVRPTLIVEIDLAPYADGGGVIRESFSIGYGLNHLGQPKSVGSDIVFDPLDFAQFPEWVDAGGVPLPGVRRALRFVHSGGQGIIAPPASRGSAITVVARQADETTWADPPYCTNGGDPDAPTPCGDPSKLVVPQAVGWVGVEWVEFVGFDIHATDTDVITVGVNSFGTNELKPMRFWWEDCNFSGLNVDTQAEQGFRYLHSCYQSSSVYLRCTANGMRLLREHQHYNRGWAYGWDGGDPYLYSEDCYWGICGSQHLKGVARPDTQSILDQGLIPGDTDEWPFKSHEKGTPYAGDATVTAIRCHFEDSGAANPAQRGGGVLVFESACLKLLWVEDVLGQATYWNSPLPRGQTVAQDYEHHVGSVYQPGDPPGYPIGEDWARGYSPGTGGLISPRPGCERTVLYKSDFESNADNENTAMMRAVDGIGEGSIKQVWEAWGCSFWGEAKIGLTVDGVCWVGNQGADQIARAFAAGIDTTLPEPSINVGTGPLSNDRYTGVCIPGPVLIAAPGGGAGVGGGEPVVSAGDAVRISAPGGGAGVGGGFVRLKQAPPRIEAPGGGAGVGGGAPTVLVPVLITAPGGGAGVGGGAPTVLVPVLITAPGGGAGVGGGEPSVGTMIVAPGGGAGVGGGVPTLLVPIGVAPPGGGAGLGGGAPTVLVPVLVTAPGGGAGVGGGVPLAFPAALEPLTLMRLEAEVPRVSVDVLVESAT